MKTAGVIGGHDFIGCDITLKLLFENYRVKVLIPKSLSHQKPLINTGLKAGENLLFCRIDMENLFQMEDFVKDCDFLIYCGAPFKLDLKLEEGALYIPVISNTGTLLKSLKNIQNISKIIFLTSVAVYRHFDSQTSLLLLDKKRAVPATGNKGSEKAFYHSKRIIDKILNNFSDNQIEIIVVSPVAVSDNGIINSEAATSAGLRYIFTHEIYNDRFFQRIIQHKLMKTMIDAKQLPDVIFDSINEVHEINESLKMI